MKQNKYPQDETQKSDGTVRPTEAALKQGTADFTPAPEEVARRAYFSYVNTGSLPGHEVQHWLEAERQLLDERNLTRIHGYHNKT